GEERTRAFAGTANIGMGADVVREVTSTVKRLGDSAGFAVAAIHHILVNRKRRVHVTAEGVDRTLDVVDVMVGNNRYQGGGMMVAPEAKLDDGELDVVLVQASPRRKLIRAFPKVYKGTHLDNPIVEWFRTSAFQVDAVGADQGVVLDGE